LKQQIGNMSSSTHTVYTTTKQAISREQEAKAGTRTTARKMCITNREKKKKIFARYGRAFIIFILFRAVPILSIGSLRFDDGNVNDKATN